MMTSTSNLPGASPTDLVDDATKNDMISFVKANTPTTFLWDYTRSRPQLVTLYNKAMASQWSSVTELD